MHHVFLFTICTQSSSSDSLSEAKEESQGDSSVPLHQWTHWWGEPQVDSLAMEEQERLQELQRVATVRTRCARSWNVLLGAVDPPPPPPSTIIR